MKTSIIGYPRIGLQRELKFASEKYFKGEISSDELEKTAKELRLENLNCQRDSGLDFIPTNDFSFYDGMLDMSVMLNALPERYTKLGLSELDTYFAAARGYQGESGDVKALAMKKWFNTNYHYMVPEIGGDTDIRLVGDKPFKLFSEALEAGVKTKPVIIGAYTFLKLARFTGTKKAEDFAEKTAAAYSEIFTKLAALGAEWVQIDEPCLVMDMSASDKKLFSGLYEKILGGKGDLKIILQTYFGDIRDCYSEITSLPFDGVGLDFIEGKKTLELVLQNGFPNDKTLFAGVVNGKNIWRNNYAKTLDIIEEITPKCGEIVLNASCSLLHVPYTLDSEVELSEDIKKHFSFAREKLGELAELKKILSSDNPKTAAEFTANRSLMSETRSGDNNAVRQRVKELTGKDFTRLPDFSER